MNSEKIFQNGKKLFPETFRQFSGYFPIRPNPGGGDSQTQLCGGALIYPPRGRKNPPHLCGAEAACQKSLAEFAARRRQRDSDHFLSGRTPGWSLLPLRGNSPPVPDRKYLSGCKSGAAALCRAQPPKAALGAELCDLYAKGVQIVRAADCNPFVKKGQSPFLTVSSAPLVWGG